MKKAKRLKKAVQISTQVIPLHGGYFSDETTGCSRAGTPLPPVNEGDDAPPAFTTGELMTALAFWLHARPAYRQAYPNEYPESAWNISIAPEDAEWADSVLSKAMRTQSKDLYYLTEEVGWQPGAYPLLEAAWGQP